MTLILQLVLFIFIFLFVAFFEAGSHWSQVNLELLIFFLLKDGELWLPGEVSNSMGPLSWDPKYRCLFHFWEGTAKSFTIKLSEVQEQMLTAPPPGGWGGGRVFTPQAKFKQLFQRSKMPSAFGKGSGCLALLMLSPEARNYIVCVK